MISGLKKISFSTVIPLIIILTLLSIGILIPILSMVLFGAILAYYVRFISKKVRPYVKYNTLAVFLGMIILAIPIILLLYFTFNQLLSISGTVIGSIGQNVANNATINTSSINSALHNLGVPDNVSQTAANLIKSEITDFISYISHWIVTLLSSIPSIIAQVFILIFSIFYFARDGDKVIQYVSDVIPDKDKSFYWKVFNSADDVLKSIIVGNVIPAAILGVVSGFIYYFLGYPYVILLAIISGIAMFIPVIGPWIVYGIIGVFSILTGNTLQGVLVIIFGWITETSTDFYIRPRISVQYSEIHPLIFLLGFIYGAITLGVPGLFIGPLILGITYEAYKVYREEKVKKKDLQK